MCAPTRNVWGQVAYAQEKWDQHAVISLSTKGLEATARSVPSELLEPNSERRARARIPIASFKTILAVARAHHREFQ